MALGVLSGLVNIVHVQNEKQVGPLSTKRKPGVQSICCRQGVHSGSKVADMPSNFCEGNCGLWPTSQGDRTSKSNYPSLSDLYQLFAWASV